ncbi:MAG: helix-turn-helix transcriptional regulator, partial [Clostridia bacterium]|nr:helix-turn-helix transcriptional regulator [Clostridia bacterium]
FTPFAVDKLLVAFNRNHIEPENDVQEKLGDIFNNLLSNYENNNFDNLYPYIDELLTILISSPTAISSSSLPSTHVNNIIDYVKNHFNEINGIEDVADKFYISKFYLCRTFKKLLGVSFISYLTQVKLKHALKLLTTTDMDISEIAFECGFNSTSYFCNIFKKNFNTSPLSYKKISKS